MEFIINAFNLILYQPLFNALIFLYSYIPGQDFGIAVILLTVIIRLIFYPLGAKAAIFQKRIAEIQPKIQEIQKKYKNDKEKLAKETIQLYQKEKVNPLSGCLPLLIQMPILIALFQVFWRGFGPDQLKFLYSFIPHPEEIRLTFLGLMDLSSPSWILAILAGAAQFVQAKMLTLKAPKAQKKGDTPQFAQVFQKQMVYLFPLFTIFILFRLPSAIGIYWVVTTLFSIFQQYIILKKPKNA